MTDKKREYLMLIASVVVAGAALLGIVRWLAPGLLGVPSDLQLVGIDEKVPPFYENVFRRQDLASTDFILKDPLTRVRAKPLYPDTLTMGPNDLLGFRNHEVPNVADVVVIGDSQTYGNNAPIEDNWPGWMRKSLAKGGASIYNMSVGGWGAVQYLDMFTNATVFDPRIVVVAFYSGNDSLESFQMAYGVPAWGGLRPDPELTQASAPEVAFPPPPEDWWAVEFGDGVKTAFTPVLRLSSNMEHVAVGAGYEIMAEVVRRISAMAEPRDVRVFYTIIPTKELVYRDKVNAEDLEPPASYRTLVEREADNIQVLADVIHSTANAEYVDVVAPLQKAAMGPRALYPVDINGHPEATGYKVIGETIAERVGAVLPARPAGLFAHMLGKDRYSLVLVNEHGLWRFRSPELVEANGWPPGEIAVIEERDLAGLQRMGIIDRVDRDRFGPDRD